jgi:DNA polymerase
MIMDYETFSEADLKKVGAYEYARHPSTKLLCVAWVIGTKEELAAGTAVRVRSYSPTITHEESAGDFLEFLDALQEPTTVLVAHNALFEQLITRYVVGRKCLMHDIREIPTDRWICTASMAAARSLPRNLEGACKVLKLPHQKDKEGHRLMLKHCKPRKPTKNNPETRHTDEDELRKIIEYCVKDVLAETGLFLKLPPLHQTERDVWLLDQAINMRGFHVDRKAVKCALKLIEEETVALTNETRKLTGGQVQSTNQRAATLSWLKANGAVLLNTQAKTISGAIEAGLVEGKAKRLLEIRQAISKTSTAKYMAFEKRSRTDSRLRDILMYHAAGTGRWGGLGVQPQNFPRGKIKDTDQAIAMIKDLDLEMIRLCYGDPMSFFSSCLRGMIVAPKGKVLDVADYASIEVRVLFWLARHEAGLQAFRDNKPLYEELATEIFGVDLADVTQDQRFVGKTATLGCGYQMGAEKFRASCENLGQKISEDLAIAAVRTYRQVHSPVVKLWSNYSKAAMAAIENRGKKYTVNRVAWSMQGDYLCAELPSGRKLCYYKPSVGWERAPWGGQDKIRVIRYQGVDSKTRQWSLQKTYGGRLTENISQAVSRDLMAAAMLRIEATGHWQTVLTVHDELIAERAADDFPNPGIEEFCELMATLPWWAEGLPIKVAGFTTTRYRK